MKKSFFTALLLLVFGICLQGHSQITSMGFPKEIKSRGDDGKPSMKLEGDSLFVCCTDGIYCKNIIADSEWEPYAFQGYPLEAFVRHDGVMIAAAFNQDKENETIVLRCSGKGNTVENITPESMHFKGTVNSSYYLMPNPDNPKSFAVATACGIYYTYDFGNNWERKERMASLWHGGLICNPSDTTEVVSFGEYITQEGWAIKYKHYDNEDIYVLPGGDNQLFDYAIHPQKPSLRFLAACNTIGRSTDGGDTWVLTHVEDCLIGKILIDQEKGKIYAIGMKWLNAPDYPAKTACKFIVFLSDDEGESWSPMYEDDRLLEPKSTSDVFDAILFKNHILILSYYGVYDMTVESDLSIKDLSRKAIENPISSTICDLQGRRLNDRPAKGIYIQNGRKYVVR